MSDATLQFRDAMRSAGLTPPETIEGDGRLRRFASNGKRSDDAGWYVLHDGDLPAGAFGDWRSGVSSAWHADIGRPLSAAEVAAQRSRIEAAKRQQEADTAKRHADAQEHAKRVLARTTTCQSHDYLALKGIEAHGARLYGAVCVVPMTTSDGELHSLQFIGADGEKRFLSGGRVKGCHYLIGELEGAAALCIAEGFATAASIHEATGYPVAVAFNAGNLGPVAAALHERFPALPLVVCADDDHKTAGNPGLTKAKEAARAVGAALAIPNFDAGRPDQATDFNDQAQLHGAESVRRAISSAAKAAMSGDNAGPSESDVTGVTAVQASNDAGYAVTADATAGVTGVTPTVAIPDMGRRPSFQVFDNPTQDGDRKLRAGVWYFGIKHGRNADNPPTLTEQWVCSPLHIDAVTHDSQQRNFGRMLRFRNTNGRWCEWAMPMELLRGDGTELRGELLAMGTLIDPNGQRLFGQYLQSLTPKRRVACAVQVGWCGDSFVLPDTVIGDGAASVIFQSGERGHDEHTTAGTLAGWKQEIAARAVGNPLLLLAVSASFAGPLLARVNAESGGLHLMGDSSTGKTTAIEVACATWGGPGFRRSWRATANGIEGAAALFNDCLLALDEISECDPREVGAIVYALGNGRGKQRASRSGAARAVTRWRCFVLSSGERSLATAMAEGGQRAKAGQSVRLLDIPSARTFGAWDDLHGMPNGTAFSDALKRAAVTHHGHAGRAYLERLTRDKRNYSDTLERIKALPAFAAPDGEGQHKRAAARFALLALAGELATEYGLTGWPEGAALDAAAEGFNLWQGQRGRGNDERRQVLEKVADFIDLHGDSRFSDAKDAGLSEPMRINRAGWWRDDDGRVYLFNAAGMHEAVKGFDFKRALDALQEAGALPPGSERSKPERIGGRLQRLYLIRPENLRGQHGT